MTNNSASNKYVVSWSGGKDGCMACYHALKHGYNITHLVNFISENPKKVRFHGVDAGLIKLQAQALGLELLQPLTSWEQYEADFKQAIAGLKTQGVIGVVFGDIYLQEHLDWVQRVCAEIGVEAVEPLWGHDTDELLKEFIEAGFEAAIVCAKADVLEREWIGRRVDHVFLDYLRAQGVDCCGEKGEFHTLVTDGPIFKRRIRLFESEIQEHDGYYLLNVSRYDLD